MDSLVGVFAGERITVGLVEGHKIVSPLRTFPAVEEGDVEGNQILSMRMEEIADVICRFIAELCSESGASPRAVGIGFPGIVRDASVIDESPNLKQAKGSNFRELVTKALATHCRPLSALQASVRVFNDADAMAAGLAATRGQLEKFIRVWTLGNGIGYGRYPHTGSVLEGGHIVVSLDPKETYCGCGGKGHLEGIMGYRAMRLRFLDLEPEEVFENAHHGDQRCIDFVRMWHRALAAATASCIHMDGPGKFYICGNNARFIQHSLVDQFLQEFVMMTPLQGSILEVVPSSDEIAIVGAAVNAGQAAAQAEQAAQLSGNGAGK